MAARKFYRTKAAFGVMYNGEQITVDSESQGPIPSDSPLLKQFNKAAMEEHFEEVTSFGRWDVETASKAPGEKREDAAPKKTTTTTKEK